MAIAIMFESPDWTRESYEEINRRMFGSIQPSTSPDGVIVHTAGEGPNGWRIVDVWESREKFDRFIEEQVMPAAQEMGAPDMGEPQIWELHNVLVAEGAAVES